MTGNCYISLWNSFRKFRISFLLQMYLKQHVSEADLGLLQYPRWINGLRLSAPNVLYYSAFSIHFLWDSQKNFDLKFQTSSGDIANEKGYYVLESFCQNVEVVSWCLYIYNIIYTYIYIYIYIYIIYTYIIYVYMIYIYIV